LEVSEAWCQPVRSVLTANGQQGSTDEGDQRDDCTEAGRSSTLWTINLYKATSNILKYDSKIYTVCDPSLCMSSTDSPEQMTTVDRIRAVAMTVGEPKNAGEIAESAGVARNTAEKYLTQLVATNTLTTIQRGRETCYYPDPVTQYFDQIRELVETQGKDDLHS